MADQPAQAFLSYARDDDEYLNGGITWLREELQRAMGSLTKDEPFEIFQDADAIAFGEHWPSRIEDALEGARYLIPVLSPSYFASPNCRAEAQAFLDLEAKAGKHDRILPIYLIEADVFDDAARRQRDPIARALHQRQYFDWRTRTSSSCAAPRASKNASSRWRSRSRTPACRRRSWNRRAPTASGSMKTPRSTLHPTMRPMSPTTMPRCWISRPGCRTPATASSNPFARLPAGKISSNGRSGWSPTMNRRSADHFPRSTSERSGASGPACRTPGRRPGARWCAWTILRPSSKMGSRRPWSTCWPNTRLSSSDHRSDETSRHATSASRPPRPNSTPRRRKDRR